MGPVKHLWVGAYKGSMSELLGVGSTVFFFWMCSSSHAPPTLAHCAPPPPDPNPRTAHGCWKTADAFEETRGKKKRKRFRCTCPWPYLCLGVKNGVHFRLLLCPVILYTAALPCSELITRSCGQKYKLIFLQCAVYYDTLSVRLCVCMNAIFFFFFLHVYVLCNTGKLDADMESSDLWTFLAPTLIL